jgi:hypothetical protein
METPPQGEVEKPAENPEPTAEVQTQQQSEQPQPQSDDRSSSPRSRGGKPRNDRRDDNRGGGNKIVGLGDHTPAFIELSFADRPKD